MNAFPDNPDRAGRFLAQQADVAVVHSVLCAAESVEGVLTRTGTLAREHCGFDRALVLTVEDGQLTATDAPCDDQGSDDLRRRVLAQPIAVTAGSREQELRRNPTARARAAGKPSCIAASIGLTHFDIAPVTTSNGSVLGLLVADRDAGPVDDFDRAAIATLSCIVAAALELVILRSRLAEVSAAFRYLTTSTSALVDEVLLPPAALPSRHRHGLVFSLTGARSARSTGAADHGLSRREIEVADLLVEGLSNRDIAARLVLSVETVKAHVSHILRKLNASNRTEAVNRYLQSTDAAG